MQNYLVASYYINCQDETILKQAGQLANSCDNEEQVIKACFEFVRDNIKHSWDYRLNPITCKAEDVLKYGTGFCYAKSHLLAALLRANHIPAGLCYQRLTLSDNKPPFCLHGLNAVFLKNYGWYRLDARGNKAGINAQFTPPIEQLAFAIITAGEADLMEIWHEPLPVITQVLENYKSYIDVINNLPDIEIIN
ncbi:MAG: transglutaminase family protein [Methylococcaceae bacterium]